MKKLAEEFKAIAEQAAADHMLQSAQVASKCEWTAQTIDDKLAWALKQIKDLAGDIEAATEREQSPLRMVAAIQRMVTRTVGNLALDELVIPAAQLDHWASVLETKLATDNED